MVHYAEIIWSRNGRADPQQPSRLPHAPFTIDARAEHFE
jgi:hypothetical protein